MPDVLSVDGVLELPARVLLALQLLGVLALLPALVALAVHDVGPVVQIKVSKYSGYEVNK